MENKISSTKHIEKLAELLKLQDASKVLVRHIQATCLDDNLRPHVLELCKILDLPKFIMLPDGEKVYYMKADAIAAMQGKQGIQWNAFIVMWEIIDEA